MKKKPLKIILQLAFLVLFFVLLRTNNLKIWLAIFLIGIASAPIIGRIYCGWICPIHTGTMFMTAIKKKFNIKSRVIPNSLRAPWIRYALAALLVVVFVIGEIKGRRIPALVFLFTAGIVITLMYSEVLWHRYLCPYGAFLKVAASKTKRGMVIDKNICKDNGTCKNVCPAEAVVTVDGRNQIDNSECLVCMKCKMNCQENAIFYMRIN